MIVRIVKMTFRPEAVPDFEALFAERKEQIAGFPGCKHLQLLKDLENGSYIFFTYSHWENEAALDHYRSSDFFKDTWQRTKALFAQKAEAWSVSQAFLSADIYR